MKLNKFKEGEVLQAEQLNLIYETIVRLAKSFGCDLSRKFIWIKGMVLSANTLNEMLNDLESLYRHLKISPPHWTFGKFRDGQVLKASNLNELVDAVNRLWKEKFKFEG